MEIHHNKGAIIRIEYTKSFEDKKAEGKDFYFGFDETDKTIMILSGAWETEALEIREIEGYGWSSKRTLIPVYISSNNNLYELSIIVKNNPIAFCRRLNNTNGVINGKIKYVLSLDKRKFYNSKEQPVPTYKKLSRTLWDTGTVELFELFFECFKCDRVVYQDLLDGTEFKHDFEDSKYCT